MSRMETRQDLQNIPRMLSETLERAGAEYAALVRRVRWGEGPVYLCGSGAAAQVSLAGAYAIEFLLGWPVVTRAAKVFEYYASAVLQPRSVLLFISASGEAPEELQLARKARSRGAVLLVLTNNPSSPLAQAAEAVFLTRADGADDAATTVVCQHAAVTYLALAAAQVLKRRTPLVESLEKEFAELPGNIEWTFAQLSNAVRSLASELKAASESCVVGGGFYHAPALRGARRLKELAGLHAEGVEASDFLSPGGRKRQGAALFLSGSRSKIKNTIHEGAARARIEGGKILAITDGNDRELADCSDLAILIPSLTEVVGSTLTLALLEWLALETVRAVPT
jgi:glutamine---fructose-6-phosphate transaminase (isomerizing)